MTKTVYFKYLTIERAEQIITQKNIRFTQPDQFNDAFELLPTLDIGRIKKDYLVMGRDLQGLDLFTLGLTKSIYDAYASIGILCLSTRYDIPLMWGHYTKDYTGVVLGFDAGHLMPSGHPSAKSGPVAYDKSRYKFPGSDNMTDPVFHKDENWKYENEWRIVRPLDTLTNITGNIYVGSFPPEALRCVIFGPRSTTDDRSKILKALHANGYDQVGQYISYLNYDTYEIEIDYLTSTISDESAMIYSGEELLLRRFRDQLLAPGDLFKAMEVIREDTVFRRFKDEIDLYTNEVRTQSINDPA